MEWRDGKLQISHEDQADLLRDLCAFARDGESRENLRAAARELSTKSADPSKPIAPIPYVSIGGRGWLRRDSALGRLWDL
jgi:hypothetical protein